MSKGSKRISDSEGNVKYVCFVQVDLDKDEQDDIYVSETNGEVYTSDDYIDGVLVKEGDFCDSVDEAFEQATQFCFDFAHNGFEKDGYYISIDEYVLDEATGEVIESEEYDRWNAWYNGGKIYFA